MTTLNELGTKEEIVATDNFLVSSAENEDSKVSAEQLKNYIAPAATQTTAGVITTGAQAFAGKKEFNGDVDFKGEITQNGEPLITDVEISEEEGNALEKKDDGLYVDASSTWTGTQAEFTALDKSTLKDQQGVIITDDEDTEGGIDRVIAQGSNANGNYRKWESGLIEQWGFSSGDDWRIIEFPVPFTNTNYQPSLTAQNNGRYSDVCVNVDNTQLTTTSMRVSGFRTTGIFWEVKGN